VKFEFYVLNYNFNKRQTEMFNIFQNIHVQEWTEREIRKYLRSPKNYKYHKFSTEIEYFGFEGLCEHIRTIIMCEEWSRCEYEICVGENNTTEVFDILQEWNNWVEEGKNLEEFGEYLKKKDRTNSHLQKWDCYQQALPNIEMIVRECIYQYKKQRKEESYVNKNS